jgi:D-alanyl-D-alanine carboxypeptidase
MTARTVAARSGVRIGVAVATLAATLSWKAAGSAPTGVAAAAGILDAEVAAGRTPSVQYRFFGPDAVLWAHDAGLADLETGRRAERGTTYHGLSITKTLSALAILQLADRGALGLDDAVADLLPDLPYPPSITVRHLLTHSAGLPNPLPLRWIHLATEHDHFDRNAFFRPILARHNRVRRGPNQRFAYSNLGYVLLGELVEAVSGESYESYVATHILAPLGLSPAELGFHMDPARHARGYHRGRTLSGLALRFLLDTEKYMAAGGGRWRAFHPYYVNGVAYGGIMGTADGFARYAQGLLDPSSGLLSVESRDLLFTENLLDSGRPSGMSMAWFTGELDGHTYRAHAGGGGGYYAELRIYPDLGRGSVILFNRSGMTDQRVLDRIDRHLLGGHPRE